MDDGIERMNGSAALYASLVLALFCVTSYTYSGTLSNGFLRWDDNVYITENPIIQKLDARQLGVFLTMRAPHNWHPVTWLSHSVDYALFGLDPARHHLVGVVIHGLNTLWVFLLAIVLLPLCDARARTPGQPPGLDRRQLVAAFAAALLFGVHPQHVESVAWASERKDLLFLFFLLPAVIAYVRFATAASPAQRARWVAVSLVCFLLSILSKPMAVTTPAVLLLLDVYPLRRTPLAQQAGGRSAGAQSRITPISKLLLEKISFAAISLGAIFITVFAQYETVIAMGFRTLTARILNAFDSLTAYLMRWLAPFDLLPYYPQETGYQSLPESAPGIFFAIAFVTLVSISSVVLWLRGRPLWLTIWIFYLVTMSPVIGIVAVGNYASADRYTYWPLVPFYLLAGAGFSWLLHEPRLARSLKIGCVAAALLAVAVLIQLTREQVAVWHDDLSLWGSVVERHPDAFLAQSGLALAYQRAGEPESALPHLRKAVELTHGASDSHIFIEMRSLLAEALLTLEDFDEAAIALEGVEGAHLAKARAMLHTRLARAYCEQRDFDTALAQNERARALMPNELHFRAQMVGLQNQRCR